MKPLKLQLNRLSVIQISIFLLILGVFLGVLCANVFRENYAVQMQNYEDNVFAEITANEIDYSSLFVYVLGKNFNDFIVFWLLSVTILGIPYMALKITSFGFFTGFFISAVTMQYGLKGIILILVYIFPHGLLYLPIALISLYKGYELCRGIYQTNRASFGGLTKPIKSQLIIILLLAAALLVASFLEAYPGAFLLKKALGLYT
ncbi:MAG: putative rane protein [Herbinix sp.]|jgi:stage II sporulation protein M|nr:putative rane protein [Herbinix sp.]